MKYVACYVEYGNDTGDGHPGVLGIYDSRKKAEKSVSADMRNYCRNLREQGMSRNEYEVDKESMEVWMEGEYGQNGCVWSVCHCDEHI